MGLLNLVGSGFGVAISGGIVHISGVISMIRYTIVNSIICTISINTMIHMIIIRNGI